MVDNTSSNPATEQDQTVSGTAGQDDLSGGFGNDTISGLGGDDVLRGDSGSAGAWHFETFAYDFQAVAGQAFDIETGVRTGSGYVTDSDVSNLVNSVLGNAPATDPNDFGVILTTTLDVTTGGTYRLATTSDDGSTIQIFDSAGNPVSFLNQDGSTADFMNNDFHQGATTRFGDAVLAAGETYTIQIRYWENAGGDSLTADISGPDTGNMNESLFSTGMLGTPPGPEYSVTGTPAGVEGDDVIEGGDGSDTIFGDGGNDTIYGDNMAGAPPPAGALIYEENFDSGAPGWTPATTDNSDPFFGSVLGRFAGTAADDVEVSRTFNLEPTYQHAVVEFDFHRIDSWDNEEIQFYADGQEIFSQAFWANDYSGQVFTSSVVVNGATYNVSMEAPAPAGQLGYSSGQNWFVDQTFHVRIEIADAPPSFELGLGSTLNQLVADESYAFDNFIVISTDDLNANVADFAGTGGVNADTISGGDGDDTIYGQEGDDVLAGDAGADTISGGTGMDTITGGTGEDQIDGGEGADTINAGDDADTITAGANDVVDGGEGGDDNDTLIVNDINATVVYEANPEDGTVTFGDGSTMTFTNIENVIIPCFTNGVLIATAEGEKAVEDLCVGDLVHTCDNGLRPVRWILSRVLTAEVFSQFPHLYPVRISKGALGGGLPNNDLVVSPQHRMLIKNSTAELMFGESEVLVAAKYLTHLPGIDQTPVEEITYIHILFDAHQIIRAEGSWSESFQPGNAVLDGFESEVMDELLELFPDLDRTSSSLFPSARLALKKHESMFLR